MPSLQQAVAEKKAQAGSLHRGEPGLPRHRLVRRRDLREYYEKLSKDELIRKRMFEKMQRLVTP